VIRITLLCLVALAASSAAAQPTPPTPPASPSIASPLRGGAFMPMNPSIEATNSAMAKLSDDTSKPLIGDADHNFVTRLVPLSQAAIDIAEAELKYGADPKLKQQAARIIAAEQREITAMQAWVVKHPATPIKGPGPGMAQWK